jgi:glutathione S-transferase
MRPAADTPTATLELWQTEWCPASHRVRQRLTELGLSYTIRQVPVDSERRTELALATGHRTIPILVADEGIIVGEEDILTHLTQQFAEPADALTQRSKAAKAKRKELEEACPKLAAVTR